MATPSTTATQVRRPWRATVRTVVQTAIPTVIVLGLVVPQVVDIVLEETGGTMPDGLRTVLLGASAVVVAAAGILTRVMAIPQVEAFLRRHRFLELVAAEPDDGPARRARAVDVANRTQRGHVDAALAVLVGFLGLVVLLATGVLTPGC